MATRTAARELTMTSPALIDTPTMAARMRARILRPETRELLVARIAGSDQEGDLTVPPNAGGIGRIRHFLRETGADWPPNPLPIDPAAKSLGVPHADIVRAQVFQNAACAWRCWYCYVPFDLLSGSPSKGVWQSADALVDKFAGLADRPRILDLSGGSPDLTPEWIVWTMDALERASLADSVYLWSDDNLSTDYVFSELTAADRARLRSYPHYGRVCCFKGFDAAAFAFNTGARPEAFARQFERFARYLDVGIDLYAYVTLTGPALEAVDEAIPAFVDRLQGISPNLPLRVVPLRITPFAPMQRRKTTIAKSGAFAVQERAISRWKAVLADRFPQAMRDTPITEVVL
jgi:uncharacterized Fe-S cluster-containing radical SAM superfamily protein